jgi:hypothetical protein
MPAAGLKVNKVAGLNTAMIEDKSDEDLSIMAKYWHSLNDFKDKVEIANGR